MNNMGLFQQSKRSEYYTTNNIKKYGGGLQCDLETISVCASEETWLIVEGRGNQKQLVE